MIRRDFMKMLSIVGAGIALFQFANPTTTAAAPAAKPRHAPNRQWLSGSARLGCARHAGSELLHQ